MPQFYFDTDDGERVFRDRDGVELADLDEVKAEAVGLLRDLAHGAVEAGGRRSVRATVRDVSGALVYAGTMTLTLERLGA